MNSEKIWGARKLDDIGLIVNAKSSSPSLECYRLRMLLLNCIL